MVLSHRKKIFVLLNFSIALLKWTFKCLYMQFGHRSSKLTAQLKQKVARSLKSVKNMILI